MNDDVDTNCLPPPSTNTFAIPNEPELLREYELYKASKSIKQLPSECKRDVYAEEFIDNERLGTLADLCVRALAKSRSMHIADVVKRDPMKLRIHYDSLDVNLPLKDCYYVEDLRFWRRVVLARSTDQSLAFKKLEEFDWRGMGISLKYVELVESCPAAYWPEAEMAYLGKLVHKYVKTLHIKHLQSLTENAFSHFVESEPELDVTSEESEPPSVSSDERNTSEEAVVSEIEEGEKDVLDHAPVKKDSSVRISEKENEVIEIDVYSSISDMRRTTEVIMKRKEARNARNEARQQLRDLQMEKRLEHERRKQKRALLRVLPEPAPKEKKKKMKRPSSIFTMQVPPEPEDHDSEIADKRNKEKLLNRLKRYDYPAKHCHHIDLSFVRYFDQLNSLTIEFLGPDMNRDYHKRHLNFSYDDMVHLAAGIRTLKQLKIFRLRNSRMDTTKLLIIARALRLVDSLEEADFGYDQLTDDCSVALEMLLERRVMLKRLELEGNRLARLSMESIGYALECHASLHPNGTPLQYLGLAHNPIGDYFMNSLVLSIVSTQHVEELNISAVQVESELVVRDVGYLLRCHTPLRWLNMSSIPLHANGIRDLICCLESNRNILHFDCRCCDMDFESEYEAYIIVKRNAYIKNIAPHIQSFAKEENVQEYLSSVRHPILKKIDFQVNRRIECIKNRPSPKSSSKTSIKEEQQEEQQQEQEFDIWKALGVKTSLHVQEIERDSIDNSRQSIDDPFIYNPNLFNLDEVREHMHLPGISDRYYFFRKHASAQE